MQRKKIIILFGVLLIIGATFWWCVKDRDKVAKYVSKHHLKCQHNTYFMFVPVTIESSANYPILDINLEGGGFRALLDLGFRGQISISSEILKSLKNIEKIDCLPMYDFRGNEYWKNLYEISEVGIGPILFTNLHMYEEVNEFKLNTHFTSSGSSVGSNEDASIGWGTFMISNLLLDLGNSKLAYADSIQSVLDNGYSHLNFVKTPLLLDRELIECFVWLDKNKVRCMLDTGCTQNILNQDLPKERTLEDVMFDADYFKTFLHLSITGQDFGSCDFKPIPLKYPIHVEAVLGMEFFQSHCVFIDFAEKMLYFAKNIDRKEIPPSSG